MYKHKLDFDIMVLIAVMITLSSEKMLIFLQLVPSLCAKLLFEPKIVPWLFL